METHSKLSRQILRRVKEESAPESLPVQFDPDTTIGGHDASTVIDHVKQLQEEGFLEVADEIDVEMGAEAEPVLVTVRGLTPKGEEVLKEAETV